MGAQLRTLGLLLAAIGSIGLLGTSTALADECEESEVGAYGVDVRLITASCTHPLIEDTLGVHHVALGSPDPNEPAKLMVFFAGGTASPQDYATLIERGAALGYHAIGLSYKNDIKINQFCLQQVPRDPDCQENARKEILFGQQVAADPIDVDPFNSAVFRLQKLLDYLETTSPDAGWDAFRVNGQLDWLNITVIGHSQGAGHSAYIARVFKVAKVGMFSGTEPAQWTVNTGQFETPVERFHGFVHALEEIQEPIRNSWKNIGIPGFPVSVDSPIGVPNFTQRFFTTTDACTGDPDSNGYYHNCHCADDWMPFEADGTPTFEPVWDRMITGELN